MTADARPSTSAGPTAGVFRSLYRLVLRTQATRGRLLTLGAIGAIGVLVAVVVSSSDTAGTSDAQLAAELVDGFGLGFLLPIAALVFAAASLGDLREDGSLVYLWLRPVPRWKVVAAAVAASSTVTLPMVVVPLVASAAIVSGDPAVIGATLASSVLGVAAYTGVFVAVGLRTDRALLWGLVYVLVWEGFISRARGAARLSIANYTRSVLTHLSETDLDLASSSLAAGIVVPLVVAAVAFAYACRRFQHQDVA